MTNPLKYQPNYFIFVLLITLNIVSCATTLPQDKTPQLNEEKVIHPTSRPIRLDIEKDYKKGIKAFLKGEYKRTIQLLTPIESYLKAERYDRALYCIAAAHSLLDQHQQAKRFINKLVSFREKNTPKKIKSLRVADAKMALCWILIRQGKFEDALRANIQALALLPSNSKNILATSLLKQRSLVQKKLGRMKEAEASLEEALLVYQQIDKERPSSLNTEELIDTTHRLSILKRSFSNNYKGAKAFLDLGFKFLSTSNEKELWKAKAENHLQYAFWYLAGSNHKEAKEHAEKALKLVETYASSTTNDQHSRILLALASACYQAEDVECALTYAKNGRHKYQSSTLRSAQFESVLCATEILEGNPEGLKTCDKAQEKAQHVNKREYAAALNNLGYAYLVSGNYAQAEYYLKESIALDLANQNKYLAALGMANLAIAEYLQGKHALAKERSLKVLTLVQWGVAYIKAELILGRIAIDKGDLEKGENYLEKGLKEAKNIGSFRFKWRLLYQRAQIALGRKRVNQAIKLLKESTAVIGKLNPRVRIAPKKWLTSSRIPFDNLLDLYKKKKYRRKIRKLKKTIAKLFPSE